MKRTSKMVGAAVATALVALACAGIGVAAANDAATTEPAGAANVSAFHENLGLKFADMVKPVTDDMTLAEKSANTVGTREFCLSCHDWDKIVDATVLPGDVTVYNKQGLYNIHDNHNGLVDCSDCHTIDGTSTLVCVTCHFMELPDGWEGFN